MSRIHGRRRREKHQRGELIITSLVDIALCLVLGFMVSMPAFIESGIFVTPSVLTKSTGAAGESSPPADDIKVNIYLPDDSRIFLNEEAVNQDELIADLPNLLARSTDRKVVVGTGFDVTYDRVIKVLDWAKQAGAEKLALLRRAGT
jgi:biopolymer transport protein ExbD